MESEDLKEIIPERSFDTAKFNATYKVFSKYSEKSNEIIYFIYVETSTNMKFATLDLLYKANHKANEDLLKYISTTNNNKKSTIKSYEVYEFKGKINFLPDIRVFQGISKFIEYMKSAKTIELLGTIIIYGDNKKGKTFINLTERFLKSFNSKFLFKVCNSFVEALEIMKEL